jgi:pSer/pThr/pTyr-binding forkhead associated (FHA) protein
VICDRCGRNNPEGLGFCQDCGRRLASPVAVVPPTPPVGLGVVPIHGGRPAAPPLDLAPPREEAILCATCGARNPEGHRFCVSCGSRLAAVEAPAARPPGPAPEQGPARLICPRCNGASEPNMLYCQFCGTSLRSETARPQAPLEQRLIASGDLNPPSVQTPERAPSRPAPVAAPATEGARLVTIAKDGAEGMVYPLGYDQMDVGREDGAILLGEDPYVSPRHVRLTRREGVWHARDLDSLNAVYLRLRAPHALRDADLLLVGLQVLRFEAVRDAEQGFGPATRLGTLLFGSPMLPRHARLSEQTVEGVPRNVYYLHREETIIGRETGDIVFTDDPFMSRRHLAIRYDGKSNAFIAVDLNSSNGTYLAIRGESELHDGDHLRVGQHLFRFDASARPSSRAPGATRPS